MSDKKFIIIVTRSLWDEPHRGRHHYASLLSERHKVLWLNRRLLWEEKGPVKMGLERISENLTVLHTGRSILPTWLDRKLDLNNRLNLHMLRRELPLLGDPDLLWIYDYKALPFLNLFRGRAITLYFANDYFGEYAYKQYECKLATNVNYVFATAPKLVQRLHKFNANSIFLPHGFWPPTTPPSYGKKAKPLIVGYVGTLRNVIDIAFLKRILFETDMQLIIAGPIIECSEDIKAEFSGLFQHERVRYLGNLDRIQMERIISDLDICLLPYIRSFKTQHNFVIKYFEYLAMGKPMVATDYFDWPEPYVHFVSIYDGQQNMGDFLNMVYTNWSASHFSYALELAQDCTWEQRVQQIGRTIGIAL